MARLLALLMLVPVLGCQRGGPSSEGPRVGASNFDGLATEVFVRVSCQKLNSCFEGLAACEDSVWSLKNVDAEIGISPGGYKDLREMMEAERKGDLRPNSGSPPDCYHAIQTLSCSEARVQGAYISADVEPFRGVAEMVPEICHGLFGI